MAKLIVNGAKRLCGDIEVSASKNAVLPILAATLLIDGTTRIFGYPKISDVYNMLEILAHIGCGIKTDDNEIIVDSSSISNFEITSETVKEIRSSIFLLGPTVARFNKALFSYPGGCEIGARPIDLHLKGLKKLNINVEESGGYIKCEASKISGSTIALEYPSVGATENLMMAAVLAKGETTIINAAREPEIVELQNFLNSAGANISGAGSSIICIKGVLKLRDAEYECVSDRIVAGTYMIGCAVCGGNIVLNNVLAEHNISLIEKLTEAGVVFRKNGTKSIEISSNRRINSFKYTQTAPYPGFPTDLQPQLCAAAAVAEGISMISERVFDNRFKYTRELIKMGADIIVKNNMAIISGKKKLSAAKLYAKDLRGAAALLLASLSAEGQSEIHNVNFLDRGYESAENAFGKLGADIVRVEE